jgi:hypothetical protein
MGNKLEPETQVSYKTLKGQNVVLTLGELSGENNYPKMPNKDKEIVQMFQNWHKNVKLDPK